MKLQSRWVYPHLLLIIGLIGCSDASHFKELDKVVAFAPSSSEPKTVTDQQQKDPKTKSKSTPMSEESDQERPTVEVAGVNLVPDCLSVPAENSKKDDLPAEINCQVRISKPTKMMTSRPRLEAVNTRGERVVVPEQRQIVQIPQTSKSTELIFSPRNLGEANALKDVSTMVLAFDSVVVNGNLVTGVSTPVLVKPLMVRLEGCADPKSYKWVKQT